MSPLHSAVRVRCELQRTANERLKEELQACPELMEDDDGQPMDAVVKVVQLLIGAGADVNWMDDFGMTPLMAAVLNEDAPARIVRELLAGGKCDVNRPSWSVRFRCNFV